MLGRSRGCTQLLERGQSCVARSQHTVRRCSVKDGSLMMISYDCAAQLRSCEERAWRE